MIDLSTDSLNLQRRRSANAILLNLVALVGLAILAGCLPAAGPNYVRPADYLPEEYTEEPLGEITVASETRLGDSQRFVPEVDLPDQWWELFQSPYLNELVEASIENNPNIWAAQAALQSALENVMAQQGYFYPTIDAEFYPTRQKTSRELSSNTFNNSYIYSLYTAQLALSYTADVFGGNRRQVESLRAQAEEQDYNLQATYVTLTSNVVNAVFQEANLRGQIAATKEIIASWNKVKNLYDQMYTLGQVSEAEVSLQEAALAAAEATLPVLEKQLAVQRDLIKNLAGRFPEDTETPQFDLNSFELPVNLPLSIPSSLVENRPDVRAAEEQLHSAAANIGVAIANRLPTITLGIDTVGSAAVYWYDLFTAQTAFWQLAGGFVQTMYDGGTLRHRELAAKAAYDQAAAQYRSTVLSAFQNVADALQAIKYDAVALQAALKAERAAAKNLKIAKFQMTAGDIGILLLLSIEQTYQQALLNLVQAQANRLSDTVGLFQALGGGWWNTDSHQECCN